SIAVDATHIYWINEGDGTIGRANLNGTGVNESFQSGGLRGIAVDGLPSGTLSASPGSVAFGTQALGVFGAPHTVTVTNGKFGTLGLGPATVTGPNSDDLLVSSDTCSLATLWIDRSCAIGVRFGPSAAGSRTATLSIPSDDPASPLTTGLSGVGGTLPQGPQGPRGIPGPAGPPGKIELVRCTTVTKTVFKRVHGRRRREKVTVRRCTASLVSGPVKFTITGKTVAASLQRHGVVYASGRATRDGAVAQLI